MENNSLYSAARLASLDYQQSLASRIGTDHDDSAIAEWNQQRFWLWAIDRVIEHVEGRKRWNECGSANFSSVGQNPELTQIAANIRVLKNRLVEEALPSFREKEKILEQLASLANQLLV